MLKPNYVYFSINKHRINIYFHIVTQKGLKYLNPYELVTSVPSITYEIANSNIVGTLTLGTAL